MVLFAAVIGVILLGERLWFYKKVRDHQALNRTPERQAGLLIEGNFKP